jgi:predicted Rossmann-fold nucleotide-binding protein
MKIIVTGGRDYDDWSVVSTTLRRLNPSMIIQGGATGADAMALEWAKKFDIPYETFDALWDDFSDEFPVIRYHNGKKYNARAGAIRNEKMLKAHPDALVIAFPGGRGTADCIKQAVKLKVKVIDLNAIV